MAAKKTNSVEIKSLEAVEQKFSKEQILTSAQYANRRDLVDALLEADKKYTKQDVDGLINKFMRGTVK